MTTNPRRPTLKDVAARAGLSVMVASYTFNKPDRVSEKSRARIVEAATELGYRPHLAAQALRTGHVGALGVVLSEHLGYAFRDPQAASFLSGVADLCADEGVVLSMVPTGGRLDGGTAINRASVDAFIFWTTTADDPALAAAIATGQTVAIQGGPAVEGASCISIDDHAAAVAIATQALRHSTGRPAVIAFPTDPDRLPREITLKQLTQAEYPVTRLRAQGICEAVTHAGLDPASVPCRVLSANDRELAQEAAAELLDGVAGLDTIIAMSDEIAIGAYGALVARGLEVPGDVALSGFDGIPAGRAIGLTTIEQDLENQGRQCAAAALGLGGVHPEQPWKLLVGSTTRG